MAPTDDQEFLKLRLKAARTWREYNKQCDEYYKIRDDFLKSLSEKYMPQINNKCKEAQDLYEQIEALGYCPRCEKSLSECEGHMAMAV